ncbi:MAG: hypothetical protein WCO48_00485 [Candidatus Taylorbacteria bacterium]
MDEDKVPQPPVVPQTKPVAPLKTLRTYESDVADILAKRNTSAVTIALAESRKSRGGEIIGNGDSFDSSQTGKKIIVIVISIILVVGGVFGAYYLYSISPLAPSPVVSKPAPGYSSVVPVDSQTVLTVDLAAPYDIENKIKSELAKSQAPKTIRELVLVATNNTDTKNPTVARIPAPAVITALNISMPDILYRSIAPSWLLGIYANALGQKSIFVVVTNNFFQNSFAGMLQWENLMADDLKAFLVPSGVNNIANISNFSNQQIGTSTATSTDQYISQYTVLRGQFIDKIIKNKDIREFIGIDGKTIFLYSFIDNSRIIFTAEESLVTEIINRLEKQTNLR